ncbi:3310_t:CDS:10 [Diversispora eburnea]|uniref:3310_t:CDS:1 n=1 Tax=Diversispora eburnea TaxID=1213867 RepID=A0A9N8Z1Y3_9GLOM|nr:3310_t:CDS:10 [Diversispora eburnea]
MSRARKLAGIQEPDISHDKNDKNYQKVDDSLIKKKPLKLASIEIKPSPKLLPNDINNAGNYNVDINNINEEGEEGKQKLSRLKELGGTKRKRTVPPEIIKSVLNNMFSLPNQPNQPIHQKLKMTRQEETLDPLIVEHLKTLVFDQAPLPSIKEPIETKESGHMSLPSDRETMETKESEQVSLLSNRETMENKESEQVSLLSNIETMETKGKNENENELLKINELENYEQDSLQQQKTTNAAQVDKPKRSKRMSPLFIQPAVKLPKIMGKFEQPNNPKLLKISVIGTPNAGKSTLLNSLLGETVSVVSDKAHTTRERILAVLTEKNTQIIFLDTPGTITGRNKARLNRGVVNASWQSLLEVDHVLVIIDAFRAANHTTYNEECLLKRLKDYELPATLILNKIDLLPQAKNSNIIQNLFRKFKVQYPYFKDFVSISALQKQGVDKLKEILFTYSRDQEWVYPSGIKTEMADLRRVEDLIRAELLTALRSYLPYSIKQENEGWTLLSDNTLRIDQTLYVERESQQRILVGKQGKIIKSITLKANKAMVEAFKRPIRLYINLFVLLVKDEKPDWIFCISL